MATDSVRAFTRPMALWCPYCHRPFVGRVDRQSGRFVHGMCPVAQIDISRLDALARDSWFWSRFRDHLSH
jgi:hypothetical protein